MRTTRDGKFNFIIGQDDLAKGLRRHAKVHPNNKRFITCQGMVGDDGILQRLQQLASTYDLTSTFPYPQIFVSSEVIIVCTRTEIYEVSDDTPTLMLTVTGGAPWTCLAFHHYVYLSNGTVVVVRDAITHDYALNTDLPTSMSACNYNGQILVAAPDAGYEFDIDYE